MRTNSGSTKLGRLRIVIGYVLVAAGILIVLVGGAFSGYQDARVMVAGLAAIVVGALVASSVAVANFINELSRF